MASKYPSDLDKLTEEFDKLRFPTASDLETENVGKVEADEKSSSVDEDNIRHLRSGRQHPRVPVVTTTVALPTNTTVTMTSNTNPQAAKPIKLLPTSAAVREFTGTDSDYSAREYVELCEMVMRNAGITEEGDKIAFLRGHLQAGSLASHQMQASAFSVPTDKDDYKDFREKFLDSFGGSVKHTLVKGLNQVVDSLLRVAASKTHFGGQVDANRVSTDCRRLLKQHGWTEAGGKTMTLDNVGKFLEFFAFLIVLKTKERRQGLSLNYLPTEVLHDFVQRLKTQMEEKEEEAWSTAGRVASIQPENTEEMGNPSYAAVATTGKSPVTCTYCQRVGHTVVRCFARIKDQKKTKRGSKGATRAQQDTTQAGISSQSGNFQMKPPTFAGKSTTPVNRSTSPRGATRKQYCVVHGNTNHSSEECFSILRLKEGLPQRGSGRSDRPSGEVPRATQHHPG